MISFYQKTTTVIFFTIIFAIFFAPKTQAALTQQFDTIISSQYQQPSSVCQGYSNFYIDCNNGPTVGNPGGCGTNVCTGGNVWTKYSFTQCYSDPGSPGDYIEVLDTTASSCSTADKYNLASYGGGDTTMLRAGNCSCLPPQELYKTCCNGPIAVPAQTAGGNPTYPDGACGTNTAVPCGADPSIYTAMGYTFPSTGAVTCGNSACQYFLGTPPPTTTNYYKCVNGACTKDNTSGTFPNDSNCGNTCNTSCPSYAPPPTTTSGSCPAGTTCIAQQPSQTVQTSCTPTGSQCSPACSFTCRDSVGNTCPATTCSTVWACQGTQWFNGGQYYYTCPASCPSCPVGSTQTVCGTTQNTCHVPGT